MKACRDLDKQLAFTSKWGLQNLPSSLIWTNPENAPATPSEIEDAFIREMTEEMKVDPEFVRWLPWRPPVLTSDPLEEFSNWEQAEADAEFYHDEEADRYAEELSEQLQQQPEAHQRRRGPDLAVSSRDALDLTVDLSYPLDVLEEAIRRELRKALRRRRNVPQQKDGLVAHRRRLDKADYYLRVYDGVTAGKPYIKVAKQVRRPVSTVKKAYLVVARDIQKLAPEKEGALQAAEVEKMSKEQLAMVDLDVDTHMQQCAVCQRAETLDQMCLQVQTFVNQDVKGQRERPSDQMKLSRLEYRPSGKKRSPSDAASEPYNNDE
ncbi:hypothetical protein YTPLAS18_33810 [Nitrospira sp.]|nr:hypothetical protein YTPLAS18_33810 [Nitrospira sp.]